MQRLPVFSFQIFHSSFSIISSLKDSHSDGRGSKVDCTQWSREEQVWEMTQEELLFHSKTHSCGMTSAEVAGNVGFQFISSSDVDDAYWAESYESLCRVRKKTVLLSLCLALEWPQFCCHAISYQLILSLPVWSGPMIINTAPSVSFNLVKIFITAVDTGRVEYQF